MLHHKASRFKSCKELVNCQTLPRAYQMCSVMYFVKVFNLLLSYHHQIFREKENLPPDKKTLSSIMKEQSHTRVDVIKVIV